MKLFSYGDSFQVQIIKNGSVTGIIIPHSNEDLPGGGKTHSGGWCCVRFAAGQDVVRLTRIARVSVNSAIIVQNI